MSITFLSIFSFETKRFSQHSAAGGRMTCCCGFHKLSLPLQIKSVVPNRGAICNT